MISLLDKYHSTESANEKYQLIRETFGGLSFSLKPHKMPFAIKNLIEIQLQAESHPITGRIGAAMDILCGIFDAISKTITILMLSILLPLNVVATKPMALIGPWMPEWVYKDEQTYIAKYQEVYQIYKDTWVDLGVSLATPFLGLAKTVNPNFFSDLTNQITDIYLARADRDNAIYENNILELIKPQFDSLLSPNPLWKYATPTSLLLQIPMVETVTFDPIKKNMSILWKEEARPFLESARERLHSLGVENLIASA